MVHPPFYNFIKPDATPTVISSSRRLLSLLRGTMAGDGEPHERLDSILSIIAADLVAEACSVYVLRAGDIP